ncbi:MAG: AMP-binding protein [Acidobacteriota bacterium]|nr:AMP-binding protein [Acidobacteriota bacterium]
MPPDSEFASIPAMALESGTRFRGQVAIIDGDTTVTFEGVSEEMLAVAKGLTALGVDPGDRVALWAPNCARWVTAALGIQAAGGRLVPVNTRFKGGEAAHILRQTDASTLLCVNGFLETNLLESVRDADPDLRALTRVVTVDGPPHEGSVTWEEMLSGGDELPDGVILDQVGRLGPEDPSDVIFTSGTTGHPKGVMLRHGASLRTYRLCNDAWRAGPCDRVLIVMPFFHCFGYKFGWMLSLMVGATAVPVAVFDPDETLRTVARLGITHVSGSPTFFWSLLEAQKRVRADLSTLRVACVSAAYVPVELIVRMRDELGLEYAMTGYGLTEAHATVSITYPDDPPETIANTSGRPLPGLELRLVDDEGVDVPLGERGEILIRGFNLADGYYGDPDATAAVFDADGWLHTGDIAYMNADGYFKVCDRKKDMFIVGGFNVAPAEIEGILTAWDEVALAAVVAVPDPHYGEVGCAFVVPARGHDLTPGDVIAYAEKAMANYKVPRRVEIVDSLPMNSTGKVLRGQLRGRLGVE